MRTWIILFLCLIPAPAFSWQVGDIVTTPSGISYQLDTINSVKQKTLSYNRVTTEGSTPCASYTYFDGQEARIYENGFDDGQDCIYQRTRGDAHLYVPPAPPPVPPVIGAGFGIVDFPTVKLLQPDNEYTAIFNYFFSLMFWFTLVLIPVKWTIRFFR